MNEYNTSGNLFLQTIFLVALLFRNDIQIITMIFWLCYEIFFFFHSHWINNCSKSKVKILKQHPAWGLQLFKETLIQVPSCEFCNTFKNTFFKEYLRWVLLYLYCRLEWTFVIFGKSFILDVWHGSEYASEWDLKQEEKGKLFSRLETMLSIRLFFSLILGRIWL